VQPDDDAIPTTYRRCRHRFFDDLVTLLASLACADRALALIDGAERPITPQYTLIFQGNGAVTREELLFRPHSLLRSLAGNVWPGSLDVEFQTLSGMSPSVQALGRPVVARRPLHTSVMRVAFLSYYEATKELAEAKWGASKADKMRHWPGVWQFAWVVRNSCAHGGRDALLTLSDPSTVVSWRGLKYRGEVDDGRPILGHGVTLVELLRLMEDMDAAL